MQNNNTGVGIFSENIEKIEILNGLSGFLYGAGNVGGVVNYVVKRPTYTPKYDLTVGNYGGSQYFAHADLSGPIDKDKKFAYRLNIIDSDGDTSVAGGILLALRWRINLLSLGESDAEALGINVELFRWIIVTLVVLLVAAQVSVSGGVGFVGLVVPHLARMFVGAEHTKLLPASALMGGIYLLAMDDIARSVSTQEIPIGLLTSFVGAPVFAFLFWRMQGAKGWNRD